MSITFKEAQEKPELRQRFIDSINLEEARPYIEKVTYVSALNGYPAAMACVSPLPALFNISNCRSSISVFPSSFSSKNILNLGDFVSTLVDHEGYHAKDIYESPSLTINLLLGRFSKKCQQRFIAGEQRAIYNQISNFERRGCSKKYIAYVMQKQQINKDLLEILSC